ncbi:MAG: sigma-70 family RNA polymerase sigma factor [Clostridia bacterium]|nr:sigma-70 family RNA polymerase sigma factor [Clostridia bacterium]
MDDEVILQLYNERSEKALELTEEKYRGLIFSVAFRILRDADDSEECVNDVLLKAWETVPHSGVKNLGAYLTKLARNAAIDRLKYRSAEKRGAGETALIFEELEECIPSPRGGESLADELSVRELLTSFVSGLHGEERGVFLDRYFYAMTVPEIAKKRDSSEGKIAMRLLRTRKKLQKLLRKEGLRI